MGTAVVNPNQNRFGAGTIFLGAVGTPFPVLISSGGVFTNFVPGTPPAGFLAVGGTTTGLTLTRNPSFSDFLVAESYYPQQIVQTADDVQGNFTLAQMNRVNLAAAYNALNPATIVSTGNTTTATGGGASNYATSGSGANQITGFTLPLVGTQVECSMIWVGEQSDEAVFIYACLNVASVAPNFTKGPAAQELLFQLRATLPATNPDTNCGYTSTQVTPYRFYFTGVNN